MARRQNKGRHVNGIVLLDKPAGFTSNQALQKVKRLFNARKAGHTGSLDPIATGLLPICFGNATKISGFLLEADKGYVATCQLGIKTNSGDREGEVISTRKVDGVTEAIIKELLKDFTGQIQQLPPMHSAIKKNGTPLYKLAHQGIEVEREPRTVTIYDLQLLSLQQDILKLKIHCSKGTYIRTLAEDIGEALGCGAHVSELRREQVGPFYAEKMLTMEQLQEKAHQGIDTLDSIIIPIEKALMQWPQINLPGEAAFYLQQGQAVFVPKMKEKGLVRLYAGEGRFLGVGHILEDGRVAPKRLMNIGKMG